MGFLVNILNKTVGRAYQKKLQICVEETKSAIKEKIENYPTGENRGGLVNSVRLEMTGFKRGVIIVDKPYAKAVNYGRHIEPNGNAGGNGKILSSFYTTTPPHSLFVSSHGNTFAGHHYVDLALEKIRNRLGSGFDADISV